MKIGDVANSLKEHPSVWRQLRSTCYLNSRSKTAVVLPAFAVEYRRALLLTAALIERAVAVLLTPLRSATARQPILRSEDRRTDRADLDSPPCGVDHLAQAAENAGFRVRKRAIVLAKMTAGVRTLWARFSDTSHRRFPRTNSFFRLARMVAIVQQHATAQPVRRVFEKLCTEWLNLLAQLRLIERPS